MIEISVELRDAARRLAAVSDTARLDAELLMAHALGVERHALLLEPSRYSVPEDFLSLVERRLAFEPVAYIVGYRDFWSIRLRVGPGALIPRPDSETLIEAAIAHFSDASPHNILDLGTGPGTLLLAALAEWPEAKAVGIDSSVEALTYAEANAAALGLCGRSEFRRGNWTAGVEGSFDLILCNPPYIEVHEKLMPDVAAYEPSAALYAGADGLDDYRRIIPDLRRLLTPGGAVVLEIGALQRMPVAELAKDSGFTVACRKDLGGRDRALLFTVSR